jgi:hypothetical protein
MNPGDLSSVSPALRAFILDTLVCANAFMRNQDYWKLLRQYAGADAQQIDAQAFFDRLPRPDVCVTDRGQLFPAAQFIYGWNASTDNCKKFHISAELAYQAQVVLNLEHTCPPEQFQRQLAKIRLVLLITLVHEWGVLSVFCFSSLNRLTSVLLVHWAWQSKVNSNWRAPPGVTAAIIEPDKREEITWYLGHLVRNLPQIPPPLNHEAGDHYEARDYGDPIELFAVSESEVHLYRRSGRRFTPPQPQLVAAVKTPSVGMFRPDQPGQPVPPAVVAKVRLPFSVANTMLVDAPPCGRTKCRAVTSNSRARGSDQRISRAHHVCASCCRCPFISAPVW